MSEVAGTLGNDSRLILMLLITAGEKSVETLCDLSGIPVASTSQHLQVLKKANMVVTRREGKRVLYRLQNGPIRELIDALAADGLTVLVSTHYMDEAERLCDRIAIVDRGAVIALGTPRSSGLILRDRRQGSLAPAVCIVRPLLGPRETEVLLDELGIVAITTLAASEREPNDPRTDALASELAGKQVAEAWRGYVIMDHAILDPAAAWTEAVGPEIMVAMDAHWKFGVNDAIKLAQGLEPVPEESARGQPPAVRQAVRHC